MPAPAPVVIVQDGNVIVDISSYTATAAAAAGPDYGCVFFKFAPEGTVHHSAAAVGARWESFGRINGFRMCSISSASGSFSGKSYNFRPQSILQGGVGDCWLLAAIAILSERPDLIERICITKPEIPAH